MKALIAKLARLMRTGFADRYHRVRAAAHSISTYHRSRS
jgi:hypothetical protein